MTWDPPQPTETLAERLIRQAIEAGEFDNLPGAGEPLPDLKGTYEPTWWVRKWMDREGITAQELRTALRDRLSD
jgi:hypothetical protein